MATCTKCGAKVGCSCKLTNGLCAYCGSKQNTVSNKEIVQTLPFSKN